MKKIKSSLKNMVLVLVGVCIVIGCLLAFANQITKGPVARKSQKLLQAGIMTVMGGNCQVASTDTVRQNMEGKELSFVIHNTTRNGEPYGAAVEAQSNSFGGPLKVLVGFDTKGKILGYTVLKTSDTPGLGAKAGQWFQKGAKGDIIGKTPGSSGLSVSKDGGTVDAITASTITSRAFLKAVNEAYEAYLSRNCDAHTGSSPKNKKVMDEKKERGAENVQRTRKEKYE
ncbi:MAG: RnfABCDGE type electron transport complex subunit G [Prevotella sp.]|jgi:electron transport complex protein RnfG|nr:MULTISPECIES: RnfABCDGE type electron transport complex subunit G [unclassified Prevotella]MCH3970888.1 RnfABCDGE type electron transport complex subunit G [Prevotella sp.]MCH3993326.1 RnfABCDGE type electron transport complex subunit G [Prevotella sp.]MCH4186842.1 RnfABCDGE type electron transport complex subunit G [Prevotella sp.]MCH4216294.1 RnfABCDGE type electron transport complex subunit G [Prevotella sp.]MCH4251820.1 RnfABCDGE type electron transport complex subunit G [Prevotella sp.